MFRAIDEDDACMGLRKLVGYLHINKSTSSSLLSQHDLDAFGRQAKYTIRLSSSSDGGGAVSPFPSHLFPTFLDQVPLYGHWDPRTPIPSPPATKFAETCFDLGSNVSYACRQHKDLFPLSERLARSRLPESDNLCHRIFFYNHYDDAGSVAWKGLLLIGETMPISGGVIATYAQGEDDASAAQHVYQSELFAATLLLTEQLPWGTEGYSREDERFQITALVINVTDTHARVIEAVVPDVCVPEMTLFVHENIRHSGGTPPSLPHQTTVEGALSDWERVLAWVVFVDEVNDRFGHHRVPKKRVSSEKDASEEQLSRASGSTTSSSSLSDSSSN